MKKIIFRGGNVELVMPVTPAQYTVESGMNIEIIDINNLGDFALAGYKILQTIKLTCLLPAKQYPFAVAGTKADPQYYIDKFVAWINGRTKLRFVVSGTKINVPVFCETITYGEQDGTNDIYADITLREYKDIKVTTIKNSNTAKTNNARPASSGKTTASTYKIKKGDTLSAICRKFYGKSSLYPKLAKYNGIKNPNLIYAGKTLKIPKESEL